MGEAFLGLIAISVFLLVIVAAVNMDEKWENKKEVDLTAIEHGQYQPKNTVYVFDNKKVTNVDNRSYETSYDTNYNMKW